METVPHTWSGSKTFPREAEWPAVFIPEEERSDDRPFAFWNKPPGMAHTLEMRLKELDRIDARIKELRQNPEDHKNRDELKTKPAEKRTKTIEVCIIYAKQAVSYSPTPVFDALCFIGWLLDQHDLATAKRAYSDRAVGRQIRPDPAFLRELCEHHGWRKILTVFSEQQAKQSAVPPLPPEFDDFLKEPQSPTSTRKKRFRRRKKPARKFPPGDERWLEGKSSVSRQDAAGYLGRSYDWIRKLIAKEQLEADGPNVTTASLRKYWRDKIIGRRH